ncbi:unnamed protein product [Brugia timori]|nr:unnamed protein product [Brugia timori]
MSQKPMQSNHGNERRSDRSVSAVRRKLYFPRPQLYTSALICCAFQV